MAVKRRTWTERQKQVVLDEAAAAQLSGQTLQSVLAKHKVAGSMYRNWLAKTKEQVKQVKKVAVPVKSGGVSLRDAIVALEVKRDAYNEVITILKHMEKL